MENTYLLGKLKNTLSNMENGIIKEQIILGESYCLGGTYGTCWNDNIGTISPDTPPSSFKKFDDFIALIDKNIPFMEYKKLSNLFTENKTYCDSDYYGGSTTYACSYFDMSKLINYMLSKELTNIEKLKELIHN